MKLYAVIDKKAKDIVAVFPALQDAAAQRSFVMLLSGAQSIFTDFPEDFALYAVADLDVIGYNVRVSRPGVDALNSNGFKVDTFDIIEPVSDGAEYSKAYLAQLYSDRMNYGAIVPGTTEACDE